MSEFKGTSGPWARYGSVIRSVVGGERKVADVRVVDDEGQSNAKLIAQAPTMLSDLKEAAALLRNYEKLHRAKNTEESTIKAERNKAWAEQFEATIAKATE